MNDDGAGPRQVLASTATQLGLRTVDIETLAMTEIIQIASE